MNFEENLKNKSSENNNIYRQKVFHISTTMSYYYNRGYYGGGYNDFNNNLVSKVAMDTNGDGIITRDDFVLSAYYRNGGYVTNRDMHSINRVFDRFDYNRDGRLDNYEASRAYDYANRGYYNYY